MAGVGLTLLYLALFRLGLDSASLVDQSANGAAILHAYVQHTFGGGGRLPAGGVNLHRLPGNGSWPDLCLCRILCPVRTALLSYAGVYPRRLLDGGF